MEGRVAMELRDRAAMEAVVPEGGGAFVLCLDTSASMIGQPELAAKTITFLLASRAMQECRPLALLAFSGAVDVPRRVLVMPQGTRTGVGGMESHQGRVAGLRALFDLLCGRFGGGTDLRQPMDMAMDLIEQEEPFRNADIVLVSDGVFALNDTMVDRLNVARERQGVHVHGVMLGGGGIYNSDNGVAFHQLCDEGQLHSVNLNAMDW
ncbi:unnamed protein product [Vitrella brassicaformis CCMP3155]|uniref:VWFA domain-containing protein n=1 Tax=Vitrella brassicaformis (strain CCMP3155) TaxID=1169540 RepID=A0A0G4G0R3_VITBC|nr:unnamed protein product [Vitrella brassicaformis CCMP3155]|eukprot:CEM21663.1 unnamed protein product [Vitrella brassicaformis CCMP3155]